MVVNLAGQVRIVFLRRLEYNLRYKRQLQARAIRLSSVSHLRAICELVCGQIDLAEGAFPNQPAKCVIPNVAEVLRGEFAACVSASVACLLRRS
jgi:hypothetical protein